jgi:hypothetical protein
LSLGHWHTLIELPLESLRPYAAENRLNESGRQIPALFNIFFRLGRKKKTELNKQIDRDDQNYENCFTHWRNTMAHGAFQNDAVYAQDTLYWLKTLHEFYDALRPVIENWQLVSRTEDGAHEIWH